jgi:hypothetical protein
MAKGLPYFKFTPSEWLTGDICFEDLEAQGLFINICAWYWQRDGVLSIEDINKRYNKPMALVSLSNRFFNLENNQISIAFLDEQLIERKHQSKENSKNGKLGGRPKVLKTLEEKPTALISLSETKANEKAIRIRIRKEEEKIDIFKTTLQDCEKLFIEKTAYNWQEQFAKNEASKFYNFYAAKGWMVGKNKMKSLTHAISGWISRCDQTPASKPLDQTPIIF